MGLQMNKRYEVRDKGGKMANAMKSASAAGAGSTASPCTPFSVNLAVLSPDDQTQVSFGISRHCPPSGPLYIIIFVLRTNETGGFQDRVKLEVTLGDTDNDDAQAMVDRGLTMTQIQFLQGPITNRAQSLPNGTTSDNRTAKLLAAMPHLA
jgi:hypothetical protein